MAGSGPRFQGMPNSLRRRLSILAHAAYWLLLAYIITVGFVSIVPQVFHARTSATANRAAAIGDLCSNRIRRQEP